MAKSLKLFRKVTLSSGRQAIKEMSVITMQDSRSPERNKTHIQPTPKKGWHLLFSSKDCRTADTLSSASFFFTFNIQLTFYNIHGVMCVASLLKLNVSHRRAPHSFILKDEGGGGCSVYGITQLMTTVWCYHFKESFSMSASFAVIEGIQWSIWGFWCLSDEWRGYISGTFHLPHILKFGLTKETAKFCTYV